MTTVNARSTIAHGKTWDAMSPDDQFKRVTAAAPNTASLLAIEASRQGLTVDPTTLSLSVERGDHSWGDVVTLLATAEGSPTPSPIERVLAVMEARERADFLNDEATQWHYSTAPLPEVLAVLANCAQNDSTTHPDAYAMADRILAALEQPTDTKADTNAKAEPW